MKTTHHREHRELGEGVTGGGWAEVRVGDLCSLVNGSPFKPSDWSTEGAPIIRIQNLNDLAKPFNYWAGEIDDCVRVRPGDVLLAWSGTPGTSFGAHIWGGEDGVLNQHIFRVDLTSDSVTPEWFVWAVNARLENLIRRAHGAVGLAHVTKGEVNALEIPLPPLAEQERIAAELTAAIAAVDKGRLAAQTRLAAAEALPAAYLADAFDGPETSEWETIRLSDLTETCSGATPSRDHPEYFGGGIPWVKTGELKDGIVGADGSTEESVTDAALRDCSLPRLPIGTLLVAMYGQGQTRGRTGLLACEATTNQACFAILPKPSKFDPSYLQVWFRANYGRLRALTENRGGNQPNLNGVLLRQLEVGLPPIAAQRRIAADLLRRLEATETLIVRCRDELAAIDALPAALLRNAFGSQETDYG